MSITSLSCVLLLIWRFSESKKQVNAFLLYVFVNQCFIGILILLVYKDRKFFIIGRCLKTIISQNLIQLFSVIKLIDFSSYLDITFYCIIICLFK